MGQRHIRLFQRGVLFDEFVSNQAEWLGTLSYLTPDTAMNHFLGAGIESSSQSTLAAAVKPNYWIPDWWQSGLILLAWAAAAWAGGLIVTKKADIK